MPTATTKPDASIDTFIVRWSAASGSERANYQLFIGELCHLLDVEAPQPASDDTAENAYCFERRVTFRHGDGAASNGFIDCYRRGAFVLKAKKFAAVHIAMTVGRAHGGRRPLVGKLRRFASRQLPGCSV